ncbi:MAG: hypothetical protein ACPG6P_03695 [Akkermansiaceae bacterium]
MRNLLPILAVSLTVTTVSCLGQALPLTPQQIQQLQQLPPELQAEAIKRLREAQGEAAVGAAIGGNRDSGRSSQGGSSGASPDQERSKLLRQMIIDRTNSGILQARLEAARQNAAPDPADKPVTPPTPAQLEIAKVKKEVNQLRININLGNWKAAGKYIATLKPDQAKVAVERIVDQLSSTVTIKPRPELAAAGAKAHRQQHYMRPEDILALSNLSPEAPDEKMLGKLSKLLANSDSPPADFYQALKTNSRHFGNKDAKTSLRTARFLLDADKLDQAKPYLPELAVAFKEKAYSAVNLIARWHAQAHREDKGPEHLSAAWQASLDLVGTKTAPHNERAEALYRALGLVPSLEGETGKQWLTKTFSETDGEGFEILTTVGTLAAQIRQHPSPQYRYEQIKLQHAAAQALLNTPGVDPKQWQEILTLYARNWLHEAAHSQRYDSSTSMRPQMSFDSFGNPYYTRRSYSMPSSSGSSRSRRVAAIDTGDIIKARPGEKWMELLDRSVRNQTLALSAQLLLKVKEHQLALPLLEKLSAIDKEKTKSLIREMITVWAENHNPNQQNRYRSSYYYYSGYNQRAQTIPLTRSKQERNIRELAKLINHIRTLKLGETFDEEFSNAFIQCHSQAEVWRVESLEAVFGNLSELSPETAASLLRKMRGNLAHLWPNPKLQKDAKTKRKDKELQAQVLYGYAAATEFCNDILAKHPNSWMLQVQKHALSYEESNYRATLGSHPEHSANKRQSLDGLAAACASYIATLPMKDRKDETSEPFTTWFYAALGSPDLAALKNHHQPIPSEFSKIKKALHSVPEQCRSRHLDEFAKTINARLANVGADLKYRFLECALTITGEHERVEEAAKVYQYYQDLVTEIVLDVRIDGKDRVGSDQPFGLFVNLRHTLEIERESGGFQRYLINQNNSPYSYNYGRPTEDYRDKFEKAALAALDEHFEVVSLTFHNSKVASRTDATPGWSVTPYAYFLLKPKGPEVDTIPPLKIDLDFLDTSGYVVLPISSAAIPIDASGAGNARPHRDLKLTMTLDEREAEKEKEIAIEIKATAHGLVPPLKELINMEFENFTVETDEDNELMVSELDAATDDGAPISTREWRLVLKPKSDHLPKQFTFPELNKNLSLAKEDSLTLQTYDDVDLLPVSSTVELGAGKESTFNAWYLLLAVPALALLAWLFIKGGNKPAAVTAKGPELPQTLNPVTVIAFLKRIHRDANLDEVNQTKLNGEIAALEARVFGREDKVPNTEELQKIASHWQATATPKLAA